MALSIRSILSSIPTQTTRQCPLKKAHHLGISDTGSHSPLLRSASELWKTDPQRPRPMQMTLDMTAILSPLILNNDVDEAALRLRSSQGAVYHHMHLEEGYAIDIIERILASHKSLMIFLDLEGYVVIEKESHPNENGAHSVALLLRQDTDAIRAYYFNPHGKLWSNDCVYELYHTRSRMKRIELNPSVDGWLMKQLIASISEQIGAPIQYHRGKIHNYLGPNLQVSDSHGVCYVFPFLLYCSLPSSLEHMSLNRAVLTALQEFIPELAAYPHSKNPECIEKALRKQNQPSPVHLVRVTLRCALILKNSLLQSGCRKG